MALFRNILLFGGWIPTLTGASYGVWYLGSDKTIEDVLKRTGKQILSTSQEFQKVFEKFEDDDFIYQDIPNVDSKKGIAIKEFCEESVKLFLTAENIEKVLLKAQKYCLSDKKINNSNSKQFNGFVNLFDLLNNGTIKTENAVTSMVHLGDNSTDDVYYAPIGTENITDLTKWDIRDGKRQTALRRKIYIGENRKALPILDGHITLDGFKKWEELFKKEGILEELKEAFNVDFHSLDPDTFKHYKERVEYQGFTRIQGQDVDRVVHRRARELGSKCQVLLSKWYKAGEPNYKSDLDKVLKYCVYEEREVK